MRGMNERVLVVEDEQDIREIIKEFLEDSGYEVTIAVDGLDGVDKFKEKEYDLLILDIMMPKIDGFVLCEMIRKESEVPIIMLTALDGEEEQIKGFDLKIDDYVTKPFSIQLLLKRVENVLRRSEKNTSKIRSYKNLIIDMDRFEVFVDDKLIELTVKEYELLQILIRNKGKVLTREELLNELWEYDYYGDSRVVDTHIKNLRKKLQVDYIETIRGVGYRID